MNTHRISLSSAVIGALLVTMVGCGSSDAADFPHTSSELVDYPAALIDGELSIEASEHGYCPRIRSDGTSYLLVLPPTAEVTADAVKTADTTLTSGSVSLGGGVMATDFNDARCASPSPAWLVGP